jgi:hypothetical protein
MSVQTFTVTDFDHWVGENNIPERYEYGKVVGLRRIDSLLPSPASHAAPGLAPARSLPA